jgi:riboflavin transporter FmnP
MLENALTVRNVPAGTKIKLKTAVSAGLIALAVILPQVVHALLGMPGGVKWLPMYLPVLISGCVLGTKWGLAVGVLSPVVSFLVTSAMGNPMPAAARLPFMILELAVFAAVSGLFSKKISENGLFAFPAVILAQISGRAVFLGTVAVCQSFAAFTPAMVWGQIKTGITGLAVQALFVPVIVICLKKLLAKEDQNE